METFEVYHKETLITKISADFIELFIEENYMKFIINEGESKRIVAMFNLEYSFVNVNFINYCK